MLMLRDADGPSTSKTFSSSSSASHSQSAPGDVNSPAEIARGQLLANADLMQQLREAEPEIADAAMNNPAKFRELYNARGDRYRRMQEEKRQMEQLVMADPFDIDAQRKIEEAIRQERVLENMEHAMEFSPESFGRVTMLYVDVEVNGHKVKAFVDSGAQATISVFLRTLEFGLRELRIPPLLQSVQNARKLASRWDCLVQSVQT